ncbi:MAG: TnsA endonuclease N-terminal domain-containing protein, partial [Gemmatimonadaceae bacterium]|nr:TnsA endonuclease N-terminal domain-containing protein [Gloeobacterales cyanobacterium ES-bin-141]
MMTEEQFERWADRLGLPEKTRSLVRSIRTMGPSRAVQGRGGNVSGRYPSHKMGHTVQFESHKNELCGIYEYEYDPDVLEYYDQPPSFKLQYQGKGNHKITHLHTPDFFVIRTGSADYEEWKGEEELERLAQHNSNRYD